MKKLKLKIAEINELVEKKIKGSVKNID